jgi:hypothetical protein
MDITDIYSELYITEYIFEYKNSELDFIQDDIYSNTDEDDDIDTGDYTINSPQSLENYESQLIENKEPQQNDDIYSQRTIKKVWNIKILNLSIRELKKYIKNNNLTDIEILQLKKERRRLYNCKYARNSREKKKQA